MDFTSKHGFSNAAKLPFQWGFYVDLYVAFCGCAIYSSSARTVVRDFQLHAPSIKSMKKHLTLRLLRLENRTLRSHDGYFLIYYG
jgi:hypothetical protein